MLFKRAIIHDIQSLGSKEGYNFKRSIDIVQSCLSNKDKPPEDTPERIKSTLLMLRNFTNKFYKDKIYSEFIFQSDGKTQDVESKYTNDVYYSITESLLFHESLRYKLKNNITIHDDHVNIMLKTHKMTKADGLRNNLMRFDVEQILVNNIVDQGKKWFICNGYEDENGVYSKSIFLKNTPKNNKDSLLLKPILLNEMNKPLNEIPEYNYLKKIVLSIPDFKNDIISSMEKLYKISDSYQFDAIKTRLEEFKDMS